jgi:hypothetical protein
MDHDFHFDEQMTRDMQLLEIMQMACDIRAIRQAQESSQMPSLTRYGGPSPTTRISGAGYAATGWCNRGLFFWIILAIGVYWFFLRPLGL